MKSIMQDEAICYLCKNYNGFALHSHHIFNNRANKPISERLGLKVWLCAECHHGVHFIYNNKAIELKKNGQRKYEETHTREEFMRIFGKNYLE